MHHVLLTGVKREKDEDTELAVLECLGKLVQNASYEKIQSPVLGELAEELVSRVSTSPSMDVSAKCLEVLSVILSVDKMPAAARKRIEQSASQVVGPILVKARDPAVSSVLRVQCVLTLQALTSWFFPLIIRYVSWQ